MTGIVISLTAWRTSLPGLGRLAAALVAIDGHVQRTLQFMEKLQQLSQGHVADRHCQQSFCLGGDADGQRQLAAGAGQEAVGCHFPCRRVVKVENDFVMGEIALQRGGGGFGLFFEFSRARPLTDDDMNIISFVLELFADEDDVIAQGHPLAATQGVGGTVGLGGKKQLAVGRAAGGRDVEIQPGAQGADGHAQATARA